MATFCTKQSIRIARPTDFDAVTALLMASYSNLLTSRYDGDTLKRALPYLGRTNPTLLACGTFYLVEGEPDGLVGCGGWTVADPISGESVEGEAHIRHFAIHPHWTRRGIGTCVLTRCFDDTLSFGIHKLHCMATLNAEQFYRAAGFVTVRSFDVPMGPSLTFPCILMRRETRYIQRSQFPA